MLVGKTLLLYICLSPPRFSKISILLRYDYREQILDDMQRSQQYVKGEIPAFAVDFGSADPAVVCGSAFYICVRFDMDSDYQTEHDRGFELSGLPDNSSLIGCTSTTISEEKCSTVDKADGT